MIKSPYTVIWDSFAARPQAIVALVRATQSISAMQELITISGSQTYFSIDAETARRFSLEPLTRPGRTGQRPLYQSVDAREGISTGISSADRARAFDVMNSLQSDARDLVRPGHIFPCITHAGGVLANAALPEAAFDLGRSNGMNVVPFHDLLSKDGSFPTLMELKKLCDDKQIPLISIAELIVKRLTSESLVTLEASAPIPLAIGMNVRLCVFTSPVLAGEHLAIVKGEIASQSVIPVRVQVEDPVEDLFGEIRAWDVKNSIAV